jgi:cbb3-type cytochrome oxidase subunit 3
VHLTDVMSHAGLSGYAVVAMVLFMLAFGGICWSIFRGSRRDEFERVGRLPLEDDASAARSPGESS